MQIKLRGKRVAIEKNKKANKKSDGFLIVPDSEESVGTVKYLGSDLTDTDLKIGQKVYFGNQYQNLRMGGADVCVMDELNVLAVVDEEKEQQV